MLDLTGCDYGPHLASKQYLGIQTYYYFLAGLVISLKLKKILEIGTSYGGSILAISRGCDLGEPGVKVVTVDKTPIAGPALLSEPRIVRLIGDSLADSTLKEVRRQLTAPDLLYIDSKHSRDHVLGNLANYGEEMNARWVVFDDIHLSDEMDEVWAELLNRYGERAFDLSTLVGRPGGFGLICLDPS